ncbi:N-acetylmuramoyl-L-alanine amidase [Mesobacterium pallidum]|uniref:N-acetylmuramoyl-L-alanine amidase n=1 Tax=Mesobacterium pallidum TaxID=2872037 RepID=UPI001EE2F207|nr:N-acetylmuramoyl-L-alanine amidase [Mesobacterium pallidum]
MRAVLIFLTAVLLSAPLAAQQQDFSGLARVDPATSGVTDDGDGLRIELGLSQGVPWRLFTLSEPDRLVVDFREVDWSGTTPQGLDRSARIATLRTGAFRPGWSRMVADLAQPMVVAEAGMQVAADGSGARLTVVLAPTDRAGFDAAAGAPHDPRWDLPPALQTSSPRARPADGRPLVVVLDPGHGGIDPGAEAGGVVEAELMLQLARELREALRRAGGFEVVLTRDDDSFVSLERRVAIGHEARADIFVSLHADIVDQGVARGTTVYTLSQGASDKASAALAERHDRDDILAGLDLSGADDVVAGILMDLARQDTSPRSLALAKALLTSIEASTGHVNRRALRSAGFSVLKAADIPSVLVEAGFLSTEADRKRLTDPDWRAKFTAGVVAGLQAWALDDAAAAELRRR